MGEIGDASNGGEGGGSGTSRDAHVGSVGEEGSWMAGTQAVVSAGDELSGGLSKLVIMEGLAALRRELLRSRIRAMAAFRSEPFLWRPPWVWRSAFAMDDPFTAPWSSCPCVPSLPFGTEGDDPVRPFDDDDEDDLRNPLRMPPDLVRLWPDALSWPCFTLCASAPSSICFARFRKCLFA